MTRVENTELPKRHPERQDRHELPVPRRTSSRQVVGGNLCNFLYFYRTPRTAAGVTASNSEQSYQLAPRKPAVIAKLVRATHRAILERSVIVARSFANANASERASQRAHAASSRICEISARATQRGITNALLVFSMTDGARQFDK